MQENGTLLVPDVPTVPYITGDGVGVEITPSMQAVVDAAVQKAYGGATSNGKKFWPESVHSTLSVHGCPTKRWQHLMNIW